MGNNTTQIASTEYVQNELSNLGLTQFAPINTPTFTGTPTAPTSSLGDSSTRLATTAYVQGQKVDPIFTGTPRAPTASTGTNNTQIATTEFVKSSINNIDFTPYATKLSPVFTGAPQAPTPGVGTNNTQIATTAFVNSAVGTINLSPYATKVSPVFEGTPTAPTQSFGDNSTKLATTAFVQQRVAGGAYSLPVADSTTLGGIKVGAGLSINGSGVLSSSYSLPTASAGTLGGIKVGSGLSINGSGILSATGGGGTPAGANTQVQFNNNGSFGASSNLTWDSNTKLLQVNGARFGTIVDGPSIVAYVIGDQYAGIGIQTPRDVAVVLENNALRPTQLQVDSGSQAWRWRNLYVSDNFIWNGKTISAPGTSTTLFLRNDGSWATPAGGGTYTLPTATTGTLGGVKIDGTTITINGSGVITATATNYTLPTASSTVLGGIKVGSGLSITGSGVLSATGGGGTPTAPAGGNTQVQFNNDGSFGATSNLTYDSATKLLQVNGGRFGTVTEGSAVVAYVIGDQYAGIGIQTPRTVGVVLENNALRPTQLEVDSGSQAWNWRNLYVKDSFVWNGKTIPAPSTSTTLFLRNDGTWATPSGGGTYTLPTASTSTLGGVKVDGTTVTINGSGVITATATNYTLPIASSSVLGGFKVGSGLSITAGGTLSATGGSTPTNPAGANTQVQFNNNGSFGATSNLTWNPTGNTLTVGGARITTVTVGSDTAQYLTGNDYVGVAVENSSNPSQAFGVVADKVRSWRPTQVNVDLGVHSFPWKNFYLNNNLVWNGKTISAPGTSTTLFLRNDGTWATPASGSTYTLPTASTSTLGGVKVDGTTVTINGSGVITANMQTAQGYYITSGTTQAYGFTNSYQFDNSANYFDVFPPAGYTMSQYAGGIVSIAYIYFNGDVDQNDALRCIADPLPDRFRVYVQNTEQRAAPSANWIAFWNNA